jgi:hypothetical protein
VVAFGETMVMGCTRHYNYFLASSRRAVDVSTQEGYVINLSARKYILLSWQVTALMICGGLR